MIDGKGDGHSPSYGKGISFERNALMFLICV